MTIATRFWAKTKPGSGGCLIWTGTRNNKLRPVISVGGRAGSMKCASHVAWFLAYGWWPKQVNHHCDNGQWCVEVTHCYVGDQADNMQDWADRQTATHCRNGHLRTPADTYTRPDGTRLCRICQRATDAKRRPR